MWHISALLTSICLSSLFALGYSTSCYKFHCDYWCGIPVHEHSGNPIYQQPTASQHIFYSVVKLEKLLKHKRNCV